MVPCVMINFLSNLKSLIYTQKNLVGDLLEIKTAV